MVSCATVKSPLGLLKCILIVSHFMQILQDELPNYWTLPSSGHKTPILELFKTNHFPHLAPERLLAKFRIKT